MKVLFIGGTGVISSACAELALTRGVELYLLNRGESARPVPVGAQVLRADIRDRAQTQAALAGLTFGAVVDWVAFTPEHIAADIELFRDRTAQYVFISSATVYEKPPSRLPITESTPRSNPFWPYAAHKIACEERLEQAYRSAQFPVTIVRPSHTYDRTKLPTLGYYTAIARLRAGKPAVVHGDGTSLWVLTHHRDFAVGFVGLLGNPRAVGEAFHITSDELLTWNQIYTLLARAAGAEPNLVHVPSEVIARFDPELGAGLLGDKAHSVIFDNSKIRSFVPDFAPAIPFAAGAAEIMAWYDADTARQVVDPAQDRLMDELVAHMQAMTPRR
jgi:nucleoside-diphosphate-sugar epimerase